MRSRIARTVTVAAVAAVTLVACTGPSAEGPTPSPSDVGSEQQTDVADGSGSDDRSHDPDRETPSPTGTEPEPSETTPAPVETWEPVPEPTETAADFTAVKLPESVETSPTAYVGVRDDGSGTWEWEIGEDGDIGGPLSQEAEDELLETLDSDGWEADGRVPEENLFGWLVSTTLLTRTCDGGTANMRIVVRREGPDGPGEPGIVSPSHVMIYDDGCNLQ